MRRNRLDDLLRFLPVVRDPDKCWEWTGARDYKGYGRFRLGGDEKKRGAHRFAYLYFVGHVPDEMFVLHKCDNPACCNPAHLFLGTAADNMIDKTRKGRNNAPCGERHAFAKLTDQAVRKIRERLHQGELQHTIATDFGVSQTTVSNIACGRKWVHV